MTGPGGWSIVIAPTWLRGSGETNRGTLRRERPRHYPSEGDVVDVDVVEEELASVDVESMVGNVITRTLRVTGTTSPEFEPDVVDASLSP